MDAKFCTVLTSDKNTIRRSLFGEIDHKQVRDGLQNEIRKVRLLDNVRWNFDFVNEKPLTGNFVWEKVELDTKCLSPKKKSAKKSLFGKVNKDEMDESLAQDMELIALSDDNQWNFNFKSGKPMEGDYIWEKMDSPQPQRKSLISRVRVSNRIKKPSVSLKPVKSSKRKRESSEESQNSQNKITDYYPVKKYAKFIGNGKRIGQLRI